MKRSKLHGVTIFVAIISTLVILVFYFVTYREMKLSNTETQKHKSILKLMLNLERIKDQIHNLDQLERELIIHPNSKDGLQSFKTISDDISLNTIEIVLIPNIAQEQQQSIKDLKEVVPDLLSSTRNKIDAYVKDEDVANGYESIYLQKEQQLDKIIAGLETYGRSVLNEISENKQDLVNSSNRLFIITGCVVLILLVYFSYRINNYLLRLKEAKQQNEYLALLTKRSRDAIISTDENQIIKSWNSGAEELYGYSAQEAMGKDLFDLLHVGNHISEESALGKQYEQNGYWQTEDIHRTKDEKELKVLTTASMVKDAHKNFVAYLYIIKDLTEYNHIKEKVRYLAKIVNNSANIIIALDASFCITFWNKTAYNFYGIAEKDVIGKNFFEVLAKISLESDEAKRKYISDIAVNGELSGDVIHLNKEGSPVNMHMTVSTLTKNGVITDFVIRYEEITQRIKLEEKLKQHNLSLTQELFDQAGLVAEIFSRIHDGVIALDSTYHFTYINKAAEDILQQKAKDVLGKYAWHVIPELAEAGIKYYSENAFKTQQHWHSDFFSEKNGKWLEVNIYPSPTGISIYLIDITERMNNYNLLINSEEKYRSLVEQATEVIAIIDDTKGTIVDVNPAAEKVFGYTREEALQLKMDDLLFDEDKINNPYQYNLPNKTGIIYERRHKRKDGSEVYVQTNTVRRSDGLLQTIVRDVTEERRVREEANRLIDIIQNSSSIFGLADINRRLIFLNKYGRDLLGFGEDEDITDKHASILYTPEGNKLMIEKAIPEVLRAGKWVGENETCDKYGVKHYMLQVLLLHRDKDGNPQFLSTTAIDVSEQKEASRKLESLTNELRNLANHLNDIREAERADIAREIHDELGQSLTVLKLKTAAMENAMGHKMTEAEKKECTNIIGIINETIQTSRDIYNELRPSMLDDFGLIPTIMWLCRGFEKKTNIHVQLNIDAVEEEKFPENISIGLFRIVQEALTNMSRYAETNRVTISIVREKNKIILEVADSGKGFDMSRINISHSHGLLGMRERVLVMNGVFNIQSAPGKGTQIHVEVPVS